ncbi:hypothetical protein G6F68_017941 [Rhizopus microsporus]|nr:hypothetical protein G6F68_017941 [Rhizopus microsporus]
MTAVTEPHRALPFALQPPPAAATAPAPCPPGAPCMKWFQDLPIARKLAVGFTLTTLMTLVLGAFALLRLSEANTQLGEMAGNDIPSVQHLGEARSQLARQGGRLQQAHA